MVFRHSPKDYSMNSFKDYSKGLFGNSQTNKGFIRRIVLVNRMFAQGCLIKVFKISCRSITLIISKKKFFFFFLIVFLSHFSYKFAFRNSSPDNLARIWSIVSAWILLCLQKLIQGFIQNFPWAQTFSEGSSGNTFANFFRNVCEGFLKDSP